MFTDDLKEHNAFISRVKKSNSLESLEYSGVNLPPQRISTVQCNRSANNCTVQDKHEGVTFLILVPWNTKRVLWQTDDSQVQEKSITKIILS